MAELLLELYSEEVPPQLQIAARSQIKHFIENTFKEENVKYKQLKVFSSPTRLTLFIKDLAEKIKTEAKEIKGPKVGSPHQVIQGFLQAKNVSEKDLIEKETDKGKFYFIKSKSQSGYGPSYISQYLLKKGISSDLYDINSLNIDWESICREQFEKKRRRKDLNFKEREKILRFLAYRGFSYEIIKNALKEYD